MTISILTPPRLGGPFYWGRDLADSLNERGIKSEHVHQIRKLLLTPLYQNADIVHTAVPIPFKLWKKPIVFTIHGDYTIEHNIWQRFIPKTITRADAITVPSQYLKQKLGLDEAVVIPNAVFPERFKSASSRLKFKGEPGTFNSSTSSIYLRFLALGVLIPYFLFNTGFIFEITKCELYDVVDTPSSEALSSYRMDMRVCNYREHAAIEWLPGAVDDKTPVYADAYAGLSLNFALYGQIK